MRDKERRGRARNVIDPDPVQVLCGSALCMLRVWNEAEWAALPPAERPTNAVRALGIGWVGAKPTEQLN